jgi:hypothetical protein
MSKKTWQISRRTMLKGVGVSMALPLLDAMAPAVARAQDAAAGSAAAAATGAPAGAAPVRMACLYMPNGVNVDAWVPKGTGAGFELSPTLGPLAPHKSEVLVLSELWNAGADTGDGHYVKTAGFLTGTTITKTTGKDLRSGGVSVDQLIAQRAGRHTPLPSLELGIEPVTTGIDSNVGYTRLYGSHVSWSTPTTPVAKEINPRLAFDRLFRAGAGAGASLTAAGDDRSVLDLVAEDARRLRDRVGRTDRLKLDEYFDSVRSVERRIEFNTRQRAEENRLRPEVLTEIEALDKRVQAWAAHPERDKLTNIHVGGDHTEHVRLMLDTIVLGFWSDSMRVSTFMFGNAVSPRNFSFLEGVRGGHHEISHHQNQRDALEQYQRINQWHVAQVAYLLDRMRQVREGERTLLDNSMVLFGSGMRDGNSHNPHNLPLVLAGRGGGAIAPGRHVQYAPGTPLCNLYLSMLEIAGAPAERFGDSTGKLQGLNDATFAGVTG